MEHTGSSPDGSRALALLSSSAATPGTNVIIPAGSPLANTKSGVPRRRRLAAASHSRSPGQSLQSPRLRRRAAPANVVARQLDPLARPPIRSELLYDHVLSKNL